MSASREKKARQERGSDYVSPKERKAREEAKATRRATAVFTVCAVVFLLCVAGMLLWNSGLIQRNAAAVRVDGKNYSAADMAYYYYNGRANLISSGSVDSSTSLRSQEYAASDAYDSWYDYLAKQASESLAAAVLYSEAAKADGFDGGAEVEESVSETISSLESTAAAYSYSASDYLKGLYGSLMTRALFERHVRMVALSEAYQEHVSDPSNFTDAELRAEYDAEPDAYDAVSVRHILVSDEETAEDVLAQWEAGARTEDSFAALAEENSLDNAEDGGLYTDVLQGMMVAPFNDWCFDEARKAGDVGIVETVYGYHVMYFVDRYVYDDWQSLAASKLASEKLSALTADADIELLSGMRYIDA